MNNYKLWNNILAWIAFAVAAFTYLSTMEPTASFWDCGEFIATADKLLVGHPPGAPFFMIIGRVFAMFAPSQEYVALMINAMSALCSAFTILFLYWTITYLARKLIIGDDVSKLNKGQAIGILGAGLVGALAYTFTDSFWFSAVEGEVYAMSSLFTAVVFWAILKWDSEANQPHASRWIMLIAFLVGLSIGVHLLNLLAIPAIALVYYYRKYTPSTKGIIYTLAVSFGILMFIMYGIVPGTVKLATAFELMFVNGFGMPYNTGVIFFYVALIAALVYGIYYTYTKGKERMNTVLTFLAMIFIGYSAFAMVLIRANAQPPMNQNDPNDAFSLYSYLNREQYGDRPLVHGQYFSAPVVGSEDGGKVRAQIDGEYKVVDTKTKYKYDSRFETLFPRMWSGQARHIKAYKSWAKIKGTQIKVKDGKTAIKPTYAENIRFLFSYQLKHMYWRYFMWNFAGRQNDEQGHGDKLHGNWISGFNAWDSARLGGDQSLLPDSVKNDKSRNTYYMLPFILGLAGIFFQLKKGEKRGYQNLFIVGALFILTGVAIVIYLNQYPFQPRERDYAYAASFYAFCIWIGLGVLAISELINKVIKSEYAAVIATVIGLSVPGILAAENWDDHDRSGRYMCRDFARNYLESCEPNAIIFTNGDNDTFPLWYIQEVEGVRTDVRVCNLSYLQTDWYIDQMRKQAYESEGLPFSLPKEKTRQGKNGAVYLIDRTGGKSFELDKAFQWLASDKKATKEVPQHGRLDHFPAKKFHLTVDKDQVLKTGAVSAKNSSRIVNQIDFDYSKKNYVRKNELMMLDLLMSSDWERPVYIAVTVPSEYHMGLTDHFEVSGLAYRIVPMETKNNSIYGGIGEINTDVMYENMMTKFRFGGLSTEDLYLEENTLRMSGNYRHNFVRLAGALIKEGKNDKAKLAITKAITEIPSYNVPYTVMSYQLIDVMVRLGMTEEAKQVMHELHDKAVQDLAYYISFGSENKSQVSDKVRENMVIYQNIIKYSQKTDPELYKQAKAEFEGFYAAASALL